MANRYFSQQTYDYCIILCISFINKLIIGNCIVLIILPTQIILSNANVLSSLAKEDTQSVQTILDEIEDSYNDSQLTFIYSHLTFLVTQNLTLHESFSMIDEIIKKIKSWIERDNYL